MTRDSQSTPSHFEGSNRARAGGMHSRDASRPHYDLYDYIVVKQNLDYVLARFPQRFDRGTP
jgi:hypothetical protein